MFMPHYMAARIPSSRWSLSRHLKALSTPSLTIPRPSRKLKPHAVKRKLQSARPKKRPKPSVKSSSKNGPKKNKKKLNYSDRRKRIVKSAAVREKSEGRSVAPTMRVRMKVRKKKTKLQSKRKIMAVTIRTMTTTRRMRNKIMTKS